MSTDQDSRPQPPPFSGAPETAPDWDNLTLDDAVKSLKEHAQTAVILELYTIPLYLYAVYSIKDESPSSDDAAKILDIVRQEMLHLGLAGNILCSLGGTPIVYGSEYTPEYPSEIFYDHIEMNLSPATKDRIFTFKEIERPTGPSEKKPRQVLAAYDTIGHFYHGLLDGLEKVNKRFEAEGRQLFLTDAGTSSRQFQTSDNSWNDGNMNVIKDIDSAKVALDLIVLQGEGSPGGNLPDGQESHYEIFSKLYDNYRLEYYDVVENIVTDDYKEEKFYGLMKASDAAYSYLLMTIEKLWQYGGPRRNEVVGNNLMSLMAIVLRSLASFLVKQTITTGPQAGKHAAAPFRLHIFGPNPFAELKDITKQGLAPYAGESDLEGIQDTVDGLIDLNELNN